MTGNDSPTTGRPDPPSTGGASDRGQAEQIDFLNGMIILLFGVGVFFAGASVLFSIGVDSSPDREGATLNADQRLVEDLLVARTGDTALDWGCVDAYFRRDATTVCTRREGLLDGADSDLEWLHRSLGLDSALAVNVTLVDDGSVVTNASTTYALGPPVPPGRDVFESNRFVTFGGGEYYTVFLRVW